MNFGTPRKMDRNGIFFVAIMRPGDSYHEGFPWFYRMLDVYIMCGASEKLEVGALDDIVAAVLDMTKSGLSIVYHEAHKFLTHF